LKSVDLPTFGRPTMPHLKPMDAVVGLGKVGPHARANGKRQEARLAVAIRRFAIEFAFPFGAQWTMALAPVKSGRNKDGDEFGRRAAAP